MEFAVSKKLSVHLSVEPFSTLIDEKITITVDGLLPGQPVTFSAELVERNMKFVSHAYYKANNTGMVDVSSMESLGGSYTGVEQMGLFWSMKQAPGQRRGLKLTKSDPTTPYLVDIAVYNNHINPFVESTGLHHLVLDKKTIRRGYIKKEVKAFAVRVGRIRGVVYIPPGRGPFPAVLDIFGAGQLKNQQNCILTNYGFVTFCLAYSNYDDLSYMLDIDIDYFEEALDWLASRPYVISENIGVIGTSYGAELAMLTVSLVHKVKAAVAIGNNPYLLHFPHSYKGKQHACIIFDEDVILKDAEGDIILSSQHPPRNPEARIKLENLKCPLLIIQGADDKMYYPCASEDVAQMEKEYGKLDVEVVTYEGAGHMIEAPYTPHCDMNYHGVLCAYSKQGGQTVPRARAQEDSWRRIIQFLNKNLYPKEVSKL